MSKEKHEWGGPERGVGSCIAANILELFSFSK